MGPDRAGYDTQFVGDPAPLFRQACIQREGPFSFDMAAGRFVVLCFYADASDPMARDALSRLQAEEGLFDGINLSFFGVSLAAADRDDPSLASRSGQTHFDDRDGVISRAFGVAPRDGRLDMEALRRCWFVLDPRLRIIAVFPLNEAGNAAALRLARDLPSPTAYGATVHTPVLVIPHVFEPEFCARLIDFHRETGGADSAILTEGATVTDHSFKRRRDRPINDKTLLAQAQTRIFRRVTPEIRHAFQFAATRMERLIVACYDAAEGGRFGPHRDNTVAATAHRRFAVSINLNEDFEGGEIHFPEYGAEGFKPSVGGALVFSCSLMHRVAPVTRGRRYACLPFVYDDVAAALRPGRTEEPI